MEVDQFKNDGSILIGTNKNLQTTNGKITTDLTYFRAVGFTQVNKTNVVIVDRNHHCLKMLNREYSSLEVFAGQCGLAGGYIDGDASVGRLRYPWAVIIDARDPSQLLVTDSHNDALRSVNLKTGFLSTITEYGFSAPVGLTWGDNQLMVVSNHHYVSQVSWTVNNTASSTLIAGSLTHGDTLGESSKAKFTFPFEIEKVRDGKYLVTDAFNKKLKMLDMNEKKIGPVCFKGEQCCTVGSQFPSHVFSVLKVKEKVYVGLDKDIYRIIGKLKLKYSHRTKI